MLFLVLMGTLAFFAIGGQRGVFNEDVIQAHHLPPTLQMPEPTGPAGGGTLQSILDNIERDLIIDALKAARGSKAKAARALGMTERLMGLRVNKHRIDYRRFRSEPPV